MPTHLLDWFDSRTGYRAGLSHLLDERLPAGHGLGVHDRQRHPVAAWRAAVSGVVLAMYYVPSPALAYDSVRFVMRDLPHGVDGARPSRVGRQFSGVATVVHMLRVFLSAGYKAPREMTWLTGLAALLLILGFSLSGYLLPWDQKAYWATTVTINVARGTPIVGEFLASAVRGGPELGALTLGRWYAVHVFLLPAALVAFAASRTWC